MAILVPPVHAVSLPGHRGLANRILTIGPNNMTRQIALCLKIQLISVWITMFGPCDALRL